MMMILLPEQEEPKVDLPTTEAQLDIYIKVDKKKIQWF
jgi:hypothetical protein